MNFKFEILPKKNKGRVKSYTIYEVIIKDITHQTRGYNPVIWISEFEFDLDFNFKIATQILKNLNLNQKNNFYFVQTSGR